MNMPLDAEPDTDDAALLARYARGDAAAARLLTARLTPRVYAQAFRVLGDGAEAEDVAQEAMLRLWKTHRSGVKAKQKCRRGCTG